MNIPRFVLIIGVTPFLLLGCNRTAPAPPAGFRLTLQNVGTDKDACAALLSIRTAAAGSISVDESSGHSSVTLPDADTSGSREGSVALIASRIEPAGGDDVFIQTMIRPQIPNGSYAGGSSTSILPRATQLSDHFTVTARSGDYPLDTPIEIARLGGKPVTLTVGKPTK
ncbi:MAG: hypothetical protein ABIS50_17325 [Luteolibacter sp.]|uniref:hypothetical protein n=1 Tax=Luteolibacter sp. TaxID=1962973 RepID=UPI0032646FD5